MLGYNLNYFWLLLLIWLLLRNSNLRLIKAHKQSGVALPLVVVTIVLATTIVVSATYSTYISGRLNASLEQSLRAEYLVKSALNLARVLILADTTPEDSPDDPWRLFANGQSVPSELLNINENNVKIDLEISPLSAKLPLDCLSYANANDTTWLENFTKLFQILGFDNDDEQENSGRFKGKVFKSNELAANLYDYIDTDQISLNFPNFSGIEDQLPVGIFKNKKIMRESELGVIPGFTPARIQQLLSHVVAGVPCLINFNSASSNVLESLHPEISKSQVEQIIEFRASKNGPFKDKNDLSNYISPAAYQFLNSYLNLRSTNFSVIAKAEFSANTTFLRARVKSESSNKLMPQVTLLELY